VHIGFHRAERFSIELLLAERAALLTAVVASPVATSAAALASAGPGALGPIASPGAVLLLRPCPASDALIADIRVLDIQVPIVVVGLPEMRPKWAGDCLPRSAFRPERCTALTIRALADAHARCDLVPAAKIDPVTSVPALVAAPPVEHTLPAMRLEITQAMPRSLEPS
jgi:hypothetical protein